MKPMNERVMNALVELLEYADYDGGGCEYESYLESLAKGEGVSGHIVQAMQILRDYVAGRNVEPGIKLGSLFATAEALEALEEARQKTNDWHNAPAETAQELFTRHECAKWAPVKKLDRSESKPLHDEGERILTMHQLKATGQKLLVITEGDYSKSTLMTLVEYRRK
jgi:hypothetical protein